VSACVARNPSCSLELRSSSVVPATQFASPLSTTTQVSRVYEGELLPAIVLDPTLNPLPAIVWNRLTQYEVN
jgi:hypothetical protein